MDWQPYTLRFHQEFPDGYRYLDKAGEFMLAAVDAHDVLPGEIKPTGAQLTLPEKGIRATIDTAMLEVTQEMPIEEQSFFDLCVGLGSLAQKHFGPLRLERNLFELKLLVPMSTDTQAEQAMLKLRGDECESLSKKFDMVPQSRRLDTTFKSGSQRLTVTVYPIAFEAVRVHRHNPTIAATVSQSRRARRLTASADRMPSYAPYAVFLEVTLVEQEPPSASEEKLFKLLLDKANLARQLYTL